MWLRDRFHRPACPPAPDGRNGVGHVAGVRRPAQSIPVIEWEGRQYSVDPVSAERRRLQLVRERQGGSTLDGRCLLPLMAGQR